jgi:hypothetical protein
VVRRRPSRESERIRGFGCEIAHAAVSRRPPISLTGIVARPEGYIYDAELWALALVQGASFCRPEPNLVYDSQLSHQDPRRHRPHSRYEELRVFIT